jgi:cardiolipin synthase
LRAIPNLLTSLRLAAAPVLAWLLVEHCFRAALAVTLLAGLTDWLDGYTARKFGIAGGTGAILDPAADKILLVLLFLVLGIIGRIPSWMVGLVFARDFVIVTGVLLLRTLRGFRRFAPSLLGKISTFFQILLVLLVLVRAAAPNRIDEWLELTALALSALFTLASGADYVRRGILMARRHAPVRS